MPPPQPARQDNPGKGFRRPCSSCRRQEIMTTDALASLLLTYGPLGVIAGLLLTGYVVPKPFYSKLEKENNALRSALDAERQRGDAGTQAALTANQVIGALKQVVEELRDERPPRR